MKAQKQKSIGIYQIYLGKKQNKENKFALRGEGFAHTDGVFAGWFLSWFGLTGAGLLWEKNTIDGLNKSGWNQQTNRVRAGERGRNLITNNNMKFERTRTRSLIHTSSTKISRPIFWIQFFGIPISLKKQKTKKLADQMRKTRRT